MPGWTNKGKYEVLGQYFRGETKPTNLYMALFTSATTPDQDINTFSQLTEITAGNGYVTGGLILAFNSTDFDVWTEDDAGDRAFVQLKDLVWTAAAGPIPSAGGGARWACITDDNGTIASRLIMMYFSLGSDRTVSDGQSLTLEDTEISLDES